MSDESLLHLIDVRIKRNSLPVVERVLRTKKGKGIRPILYFIEHAAIDSVGCLSLKPNKKWDNPYGSPYMPMEDDGTVPALEGKWYDTELIAKWLRQHSAQGGRLIQHSTEGDGRAWGWEFDGRGRMRYLELGILGHWE